MPSTTGNQSRQRRPSAFVTGGVDELISGTKLKDLAYRSQVPEQCPDPTPGDWKINAKLWLGKFSETGRAVLDDKGRIDHEIRFFPTRDRLDAFLKSDRVPKQIRESTIDWFSYGDYMDSAIYPQSALMASYVPLVPGPATRQQYWADYFRTSALAFEAYQHDPLAHRGTEIGVEFVLGRGVESKVRGKKGQQVWDAWWEYNNMGARLEEWIRNLGLFGELFVRWFDAPPGAAWSPPDTDAETDVSLIVRELDPATIYEVVTDQEDRETVYFYHQQFTTRTEAYAPPRGATGAPTGPTPSALTKFVVRQIDASEIDHVRINAVASEVRGRPDLFPSLGFLRQFRDLTVSRIVKQDMEARMVYDLSVSGTPGDVTATRNSLFPGGRPPDPGSVFGHNDQVTIQGLNWSQSSDAGIEMDYDTIIGVIAAGMGVTREYLIPSARGGARANALVATEPGAKRFELRQQTIERLLHGCFRRVAARAGLTGDDATVDFIFPSIATEDRSSKLKDLAFCEGMDWISKETAATIGAREMGQSKFDFAEEQDRIAAEWDRAKDEEDGGDQGEDGAPAAPAQGGGVIRRPMILTQFRQEPKLDPTKASGGSEDQPPGLLVTASGAPAAPGGSNGDGPLPTPTAPGRGGMPKDENPLSPEGAANIRQDQRPGRESRVVHVDDAVRLIREARRPPRRRPDDPEFAEASDEYRAASRSGLKRLVDSLKHPAQNHVERE